MEISEILRLIGRNIVGLRVAMLKLIEINNIYQYLRHLLLLKLSTGIDLV